MDTDKLRPCKTCGRPIARSATICPGCGEPQPWPITAEEQSAAKREARKSGLTVLGVLAGGFAVSVAIWGFESVVATLVIVGGLGFLVSAWLARPW